MTLRTAKNNKPITITSWCIVFPHNGGTMVQVMGERIHLVNGYEETLQELGLTDSGANQQHVQALERPIENSGGGSRGYTNMTINCNGYELTVDPQCHQNVAQGVMKDENCLQILKHWLQEYESYHDRLPEYVNKNSISLIYRCRHWPEKACKVLTWHFNSKHRRAAYFRNQGMFDAAVSLKELEQNYSFMLEEQTQAHALTNTTQAIAFDPQTGEMI